MDLVSVTTSPGPSHNGRIASPRRLFSFLSVAWGFVSDVDIESERCVCVFFLSIFKGKLPHAYICRTICDSTRSDHFKPWYLSSTLHQVPWSGLGSLHPGHPCAHSVPTILQRPTLLPPSVCGHPLSRRHPTASQKTPLPEHHRGPGWHLQSPHPPHLLRHGHQRTEEPTQGRRRARTGDGEAEGGKEQEREQEREKKRE